MKKIILLYWGVFIVLSSAGSGTAAPAAAPETADKQEYTVNCSGIGIGWEDCYREAETLCPEGFSLIRKSTGVVSAPVYGRYTLVPGKKLVIECNEPGRPD